MVRYSMEELILDAAYKLLQEKRIEDITVEEIIKESSVSKRTFYKYFSDKFDVCNRIYDVNLDKFWGINDERQSMVGFLTRASEQYKKDPQYRKYSINSCFYNGQNSLNEHIVEKGVDGMIRLLLWNQCPHLITDDNRLLFEFYMRGIVGMTNSMRQKQLNKDIELFGVWMFRLFPKDLYQALTQTPENNRSNLNI